METETQFNKDKDYKGFKEYLMLKELAESSIYKYSNYYKLFPVDNVTPEAVKQYLLDHRGNVARAFVRNYLEFRQIHDIKIPVKSGRKKVRLPPKLTDEEIKRLRYSLYKIDAKYGLMLDLTLDCALRRAECVNLKVNYFDWTEWGKDVTKPMRANVIGKGNKERTVVVSPRTANLLKEYIKPLLKENIIQMNSRIFNIGERRWWEVLKIASETILGRKIKTHSLRHDTSTKWFDKGMNIIDIKVLLGHSSISTTQLYLHPDKEETLKKIESLYSHKTLGK